MRTALFAVIVCLTTSVHAGVVYRTSDHRVVSIDGARFRIESETFPEPHTYDTVISTDGGATKTYLNRTLRTWYESKPEDPVPATSRRFRSQRSAELDKNATVEAHDEPTDESVAGHLTEKHVIRISYRMKEHFGRDTVRSNVTATVVVWTTADFPRGPLPFDVRTSWPDVDRRLDEIAAAFRGLIVREVWTVGFWYDGGKPVNDARSWSIDEIAARDVPPATFNVPAEYAHQFPVVAAPGVVSH